MRVKKFVKNTRKWKRVLTGLLTACLLLAGLPTLSAAAAYETPGGQPRPNGEENAAPEAITISENSVTDGKTDRTDENGNALENVSDVTKPDDKENASDDETLGDGENVSQDKLPDLGFSQQVSGNDILENAVSEDRISESDISGNDLFQYGEDAEGGRIVGGYIELPEDRNISVVDEGISLFAESTLPESYIPETGTLPVTRNQYPYGSCWAHTAMALAEIDMIKNGGADSDVDFSELHLAYFSYSGTVKDPLGGLDGDVNTCTGNNFLDRGGNLNLAKNVLASWVGAADEDTAPYSQAKDALENGLSSELAFADVVHLQNYYSVNLQENRKTAKQMILEYGGLGASYHDNATYFNTDNNCYYNYETASTNHAITIVGWDDTFSASNFTKTPENDGAWLIRNSWSAGKDTDSRGPNTYFWMSYYDKTLSGGHVFDFEAADTYQHNYQYDGGMQTGASIITTSKRFVRTANVFTAKGSEKGEWLKAVGIGIYKAQTPYKVSIYVDLTDPDDPESGMLMEEAVTSGISHCEGFYTVELETPVALAPGDTFAVVVDIEAPQGSTDNKVYLAKEAAADSWYQCKTAAQAGQSFYVFNGAWKDYGADKGANLRIKAYTVDDDDGGAALQSMSIKGADSVAVGGTGNLHPVFRPAGAAGAVQWSSSDERVLTVDDQGAVTGIAPGYATVTASAGAVEASLDLTCEPDLPDVECSYRASVDGLRVQWPGNENVKKYYLYRFTDGDALENREMLSEIKPDGNNICFYLDETAEGGREYTYELEAAVDYIRGSSTEEKTKSIAHVTCTMPQYYTLTYHLDGGANDSDNPAFYESGQTVDLCSGAVKTGYTFAGWYTDEPLTQKIGQITPDMAGDMELYAKWDVIPYQISYRLDENADTGHPALSHHDNPTSYTVETPDILLRDAVGDGYLFEGWYNDPQYQMPVTEIPAGSTGDMTLYGKWSLDMTLKNAEMSLPAETFVYTGFGQTPQATLVHHGVVLTQDQDYTLSYADNVDAGTATVTAEGIGSYHGSISKTFTITPARLRIQAKDKTIQIGDGLPAEGEYEYEVDGLLSDDQLVTAPGLTCSVTAADTKKTGQYVIRPSGADAGPNYTITYKEGLLTVSVRRISYKIVFDGTESACHYTGKAWKPAVNVYDGRTLLKAGRDYTIKYFNNINANQGGIKTSGSGQGDDFNPSLPYIQITGKGNYDDEVKANFDILPAVIGDGGSTLAEPFALAYTDQFVYSSKAIKPFRSIKYKKSMVKDRDYKLTLTAVDACDDLGNAVPEGTAFEDAAIPAAYGGEFLLTVKGIGNYTGSVSRKIYVTNKWHLIKNAKITLGKNQKNKEWDGGMMALTPSLVNSPDTFTVKIGTIVLRPNRDYTVSYRNMDRVGKAELIITGMGEYAGTKTVNFNIKGKAFSAKTISVTGVTDQKYNGSAITQDHAVLVYGAGTAEERTLQYGTDYSVSYSKNSNKGTATITFTGSASAGFSGSFKKQFKITANSIVDTDRADSMHTISVSYSKTGAKPAAEIILTDEQGTILQNGKDYTLSYKNNRTVAKAADENAPTITVKGKGNYQGSFDIPFTITKADLRSRLEDGDIVIQPTAVAYQENKADSYTYMPRIKLMEGKTALRAGTDYVITYLNNTQADYEAYLQSLASKSDADDNIRMPKAVITVTPDSNYTISGTENTEGIEIPLPIYQNKLTKSNLHVDVQEAVYTGVQIEPEVTVSYQDETGWHTLTENKNYTVTYGANIKSGKKAGSVTISGVGPHYGGNVTVKFEIQRKKINTEARPTMK